MPNVSCLVLTTFFINPTYMVFTLKPFTLVCGVFVHNKIMCSNKKGFLHVQVRVVVSYEYMIAVNE